MAETDSRLQVKVYVLVPLPQLSERDAKLELDTAVQYLVKETKAHERKVGLVESSVVDRWTDRLDGTWHYTPPCSLELWPRNVSY